RFEQAVHRALHAAGEVRAVPDRVTMGCRVQVAAAATLVSLVATPPEILRAAKAGHPFPAVSGPAVLVLIAPEIPGLWRRAQDSEVAVFEACSTAGERGVHVTSRAQVATVRNLLSIGALEAVRS